MEGKINPFSLSMADAALLLTKASGRRITEEMLREAVAAGLGEEHSLGTSPAGANLPIDTRNQPQENQPHTSNLNLLILAAWLNKAMRNAE